MCICLLEAKAGVECVLPSLFIDLASLGPEKTSFKTPAHI